MNRTMQSIVRAVPERMLSWLALAASAVAIVLTGFLLLSGTDDRIAVVRSGDLIRGYKAMQDAQERYDNKQKAWQANLTTLEEDFQSSVDAFQAEKVRLSGEELRRREEELDLKHRNYMQYSRTLQEKAAEEETEMMQGVLNRINSFVMQYGAEHGYNVILGTTAAGNVLYGRETVDITDDVLRALNAEYNSGTGEVHNVSQ